jgi:hypothetical protein
LAINLLGNPQLTHEDLLDGLNLALEAKEFTFVQKIIETKKLEAPVAGDLFKTLIQKQQVSLVRAVIEHCQLFEGDFKDGLFLAISSKQIDLAQFLIENPKNKDFLLKGEFQKIIENEQYELARVFAQARQISDADLIEGVIKAFEKQELNLIQKLIEMGKLKDIHYKEIGKRLALAELMNDLQWLYITKSQAKIAAPIKIEVPTASIKKENPVTSNLAFAGLMTDLQWLFTTKSQAKTVAPITIGEPTASIKKENPVTSKQRIPLLWVAYLSGATALIGVMKVIADKSQEKGFEIPDQIFDRLDRLKSWFNQYK